MLSDNELDQLRAAIAEVETRTDAELVTVLASRADEYLYIPTLWAALIALFTPLLALLSPAWLDALDIFILQLIVFVVVATLLRLPWILARIIPRRVRNRRAANLARRAFLANGLHHTAAAMGLMIFVCEQEHYVEIIADRGIAERVEDARWAEIVDQFVTHVKSGEVYEGFSNTVRACGDILADVAPATSVKDELPNHLVVVDLDETF